MFHVQSIAVWFMRAGYLLRLGRAISQRGRPPLENMLRTII